MVNVCYLPKPNGIHLDRKQVMQSFEMCKSSTDSDKKDFPYHCVSCKVTSQRKQRINYDTCMLKAHIRDKPLYGTLTSGLCWSPWLIPHNVLLSVQNAGSADKRTRPWSNHGVQCSIARTNMAVRITLHTSQNSSRVLAYRDCLTH